MPRYSIRCARSYLLLDAVFTIREAYDSARQFCRQYTLVQVIDEQSDRGLLMRDGRVL